MNKRPLGPALGMLGGCLALYSLTLPWLVIDPGGGFGRPIRASGWPSLSIAACAVVLLGLAVVSVRAQLDLRIWQVGIAAAIATLALIAYSGPLTNALAEQSTTDEYFVLGWGPKLVGVAAALAILGAIATTRLRRRGEVVPSATIA
jgi:hypothetical protein